MNFGRKTGLNKGHNSLRKLGLIGGLSWVSTATYLEQINRFVQRRATRRTTAPLLIESLDFADAFDLREGADWTRYGDELAKSASRLEQAGATALLICANSMHRTYDQIAAAVDIPVIHSADCIGTKMASDGVTNVALIGRRSVMIENFYRQRLVSHGVDLMAPDMGNVELVDRIISEELMVGKTSRNAERELRTIIAKKAQAGAKAIVLACTELELVVDVDANVLPIYDSARIHCEAAADWILGEG